MLKLKHHYHNKELGTLEVFMGNVFNITDGKPCMVLRNAKGEERTFSAVTFDMLVKIGQIKRGEAV